MLAHGNIITQVTFVNTTKRAQEISHGSPKAFDSIYMYFTDAIAVVIASPFLLAMTDRRMWTQDMVVTLPFVSKHFTASQSKLVDVLTECSFVGIVCHAQVHLSTLVSNCSHHRRTVILIRAMSALFIGSTAWWSAWSQVFFTFFPQRSGTFHLFQSAGLPKVHWFTGLCRFPEATCVDHGLSGG